MWSVSKSCWPHCICLISLRACVCVYLNHFYRNRVNLTKPFHFFVPLHPDFYFTTIFIWMMKDTRFVRFTWKLFCEVTWKMSSHSRVDTMHVLKLVFSSPSHKSFLKSSCKHFHIAKAVATAVFASTGTVFIWLEWDSSIGWCSVNTSPHLFVLPSSSLCFVVSQVFIAQTVLSGSRLDVRYLLLWLRFATGNQVLDPWVYILFRRSILKRIYPRMDWSRGSIVSLYPSFSTSLRKLTRGSLGGTLGHSEHGGENLEELRQGASLQVENISASSQSLKN